MSDTIEFAELVHPSSQNSGANAAGRSNLQEGDESVITGSENEITEEAAINNTASEMATVSPNNIAWPWLHEDLFLQQDLNLDWFDNHNEPTVGVANFATSQAMFGTIDAALVTDVNAVGYQSSSDGANIFMTLPSRDARRTQLIDSLIASACAYASSPLATVTGQLLKATFYENLRVNKLNFVEVFDLEVSLEDDDSHGVFARFIQLYLDNFWPLWPLSPRQYFHDFSFEPVLYLAMASIGAMYGSRSEGVMGTMLHTRLREELIKPLLDLQFPRKSLLALGQARVLTQAAALYFGHQHAFSYAQQLSGSLLSLARKLGLFTSRRPEVLRNPLPNDLKALEIWVNDESQKRLALAILRLEMYTSVLHSTKPQVAAEEVQIHMLCSSYLWTTLFETSISFIMAVNQDLATRKVSMFYSDLLRVIMDPEEVVPCLDLPQLELVMNGMQARIWSACEAKGCLSRLNAASGSTSDHDQILRQNEPGSRGLSNSSHFRYGLSLDEHLLCGSRALKSLHDEIERVTLALVKIQHQALSEYRENSPKQNVAHRSSLLTCILVFHLASVQLHAPLDLIHLTCHARAMRKPSDHGGDYDAIDRLCSWVQSKDADTAVASAIRIYHLLKSETNKLQPVRAKVNFLTMVGLYHSAVVLWVRSQAKRSGILPSGDFVPTSPIDATQDIGPAPSISQFVQVFKDIQPAWAARCSFLTAIEQLEQASPLFTE